jgi:hypothetical protein
MRPYTKDIGAIFASPAPCGRGFTQTKLPPSVKYHGVGVGTGSSVTTISPTMYGCGPQK